jgi:hypothetical protein
MLTQMSTVLTTCHCISNYKYAIIGKLALRSDDLPSLQETVIWETHFSSHCSKSLEEIA